ncbi:uncharacterized protein LOC132257809 [Phlebotomus argentipes]|uniref:uncharacterized protein LOC132257809 n=1 Tax=Phlebotomus argentipes TaxID=94469 RepID=UPI002892FE85|nr:uncharacterized protein LOC132257809 [Phlebotomus argentipes]
MSLHSEMERQELECRFQNLMRSSNECEKSSLKVLRAEYKKFMDEDRQRAERNENLLQTLDRIDFQAAALAAKTERLKLLKTQYKTLLLKNWNDTGSRIVSHRSNISSPQDSVPMRYARTSPVYHYQGPNYWSEAECGAKSAPQIRDMEIQTSLSMFDMEQSSSVSSWAASGVWRESQAPRGGNQGGKSSRGGANHLDNSESGEKVTPELNKTLPNSAATSTITTSKSDYSTPAIESHSEAISEAAAVGGRVMNEDTPKTPTPTEEPHKEPFYLRDVPERSADEQEVEDGRGMPECDIPANREGHEEVAQKTIDSGQEIREQLGNLSREPAKPHTSSLRHALLKNTKHELMGSRSGGDKGGQKVVKRVEFCLDQNESHEDTKSQWNVDGIRATAPTHQSAEIEEDTQEYTAEERPLMSPYQRQPPETFEAHQMDDQFDDEYDPDELESVTQEESHTDGIQFQEDSGEVTGEILDGQRDYITEDSHTELTQQTANYQHYPDTVQETDSYYAGVEDNLQPVVGEGAYIQDASFAAQGDYMPDNVEPQSDSSSTPAAQVLTQDTMVEQSESSYQQFISPDATAQPDTYLDSGFTAQAEYLGAPQQQQQEFGPNEVYPASEYQYEGAAINQQPAEYVNYDVTGAAQEYDPNQGMVAYEQNYATYDGQDVHYPAAGTMQEGYEQGYSDVNYVEAGGGDYAGADAGQGYEQGREGVYMSEAPQEQIYPNFQNNQYGQQEEPGDYYNLSEQPVASNQEAGSVQTLQAENANQEATSLPTTYSDDSATFAPQQPLAEPEDTKVAKSNFLDSSSSSESERRPKVKFADEVQKAAVNDESDFDFSSHRDDK